MSDDVRRELALVRQRRLEAVRLAADLAREQAALEAELRQGVAADPADLERRYGAVRSAADLPAVIRAWRRNIPSVSALSAPVDPGRDHVRGDLDAPVLLVEYGDYQCVECAEAHDLYERVRPWLEDGRLCAAFRHFPLVDAHPFALRAAQAAEAAAAQGRFWDMHDALMRHGFATDDDRQQHVLIQTPRDASELEHAARRAGLDVERFRADIDDAAALERILDDFRGGLASGVSGTPTFYLNGERVDIMGVEELYERVAELATA
jgi:protein-disulfide isomerase